MKKPHLFLSMVLGMTCLFSFPAEAGFVYKARPKPVASREISVEKVQKDAHSAASDTLELKPLPSPCSGKKTQCQKKTSSQKKMSPEPKILPSIKSSEQVSSSPVKETEIPVISLSQEREIKESLPQWRGDKGSSLRHVVEQWTREASVDLEWGTEFDYPLLTSFSTQGTFEEALKTLLDAFSESVPRPYGRLHKNGRHSVLVIQTRGKNHYDQ